MMGLFDFDYPSAWSQLSHESKPIVLYGMGNGADKVLDEMYRRGIQPAGVMASDGFVRHQPFRGFTVKSQRELEDELGDFLVALCFASSLDSVIAYIRQVAREHELVVPHVPVCGDGIIDDSFVARYRGEIARAYALLSDERSRATLAGALHFLYTGRLEYLDMIECGKDEVFRDILRLRDERCLDLGAYRGDTVEEFLYYTDGYRHITAVEPNPKNYRKLLDYCASVENCTALNMGIADSIGTMTVSKKAGRMANTLSDSGVAVPVTTVDALALSPTYIKADIEGMEHRMLRGAAQTLKDRPKLNLAAYHRAEDFFSLILRLHELNPDYRIYLRKHRYIPCWDLNIYAI